MDAAEWDRRYASAELVWGRPPNQFVAAEFADAPAGRALDLGAGEGRNAIWLASRGWQVTAVDFSSVAVDKGRRLAEQAKVTIDWQVADVLRYQPPAAAFDLVLIAYLQLPAAELAQVLARAADALAPGGVLFAVGHDRTNLTDGVGGPQDPAVLYDLDTLAAQLRERDGMAVERAERVRRTVTTADGERQAIDTLIRARRASR